jgi:hypothetical protein
MNIQRLVGKHTAFFAVHHSSELALMQLKVIAAIITHGPFMGGEGDVVGPVFSRLHERHTQTDSQERENNSFHRNTSQWLIRRKDRIPVSPVARI